MSYFKAEAKVLAEIPNGSSDKTEDRNSREFTQEMRGVNLVKALSILNWRIQVEVAKYLYCNVRWCFQYKYMILY